MIPDPSLKGYSLNLPHSLTHSPSHIPSHLFTHLPTHLPTHIFSHLPSLTPSHILPLTSSHTHSISLLLGYIDLSKRRVSPEEIQKCEEKYSKAKTVSTVLLAHTILKRLSGDEACCLSRILQDMICCCFCMVYYSFICGVWLSVDAMFIELYSQLSLGS